MALKIKKKKFKRKGNTHKRNNSSSFSAWKQNYRRERERKRGREMATTLKLNIISNKAKPSKPWRKDLAIKTKSKIKIPSNRNCDISVSYVWGVDIYLYNV
jgi:hypothetical protein